MKNLHVEFPKPIKLSKKNLIGSCLFFLMIWTFNLTRGATETNQAINNSVRNLSYTKHEPSFLQGKQMKLA
jgi:hypothetical protein